MPSYQDLVKQMNGMHKLYTCGSDRQPTSNAGSFFTGSATATRPGQGMPSAAGAAAATGRSSSPRDRCEDAQDGAGVFGGGWPNLESLMEAKPRMPSGSGAVSDVAKM